MIRPPLKTVRVESKAFPSGILINADEFNPEKDKLFSDPEAATDKTAVIDKAAAK